MTHSRSAVAAACAFHVLSLLACGSDRPVAMIAPTAVIAPSLEQRLATTADAGFTITSLVGGTSCPTLEFRISTYLT
jgi:hypothetical protein